jgi:hypothetical protein
MIRLCQLSSFLVFAFFLIGCSPDTRTTDIKECTVQTQQEMSKDPSASRALANQSAEQRHDAIGNIISACMEQRGYKHDDGAMTDQRCVDDVDYNPYCYLKGR